MYEDEGGRSRTKPEGIKSKVERESQPCLNLFIYFDVVPVFFFLKKWRVFCDLEKKS